MTNAPRANEAILVKISYLWTTLFHFLICVQLIKATLILKRREYYLEALKSVLGIFINIFHVYILPPSHDVSRLKFVHSY